MTRQSQPYTREDHHDDRNRPGGQDPTRHGNSSYGDRHDNGRDEWLRSTQDFGQRAQGDERSRPYADEARGTRPERGERSDRYERSEDADREGRSWRAGREADGRDEAWHARETERDPWTRGQGRRSEREEGNGWDRSGQTVSAPRRDEDNDPRPYDPGSHRRSAQPHPYSAGRFEAESASGPYTGKGPKGYKRSGERLKEEISDRLERQGDVDASGIEVECKDGIVTLKGEVPDRGMKRRAEACVEAVYGVEDVMNQLRVEKSASSGSSTPASSRASQEQERGTSGSRKG